MFIERTHIIDMMVAALEWYRLSVGLENRGVHIYTPGNWTRLKSVQNERVNHSIEPGRFKWVWM